MPELSTGRYLALRAAMMPRDTNAHSRGGAADHAKARRRHGADPSKSGQKVTGL